MQHLGHFILKLLPREPAWNERQRRKEQPPNKIWANFPQFLTSKFVFGMFFNRRIRGDLDDAVLAWMILSKKNCVCGYLRLKLIDLSYGNQAQTALVIPKGYLH